MEKAVLKTLIYADIFDYPLKINEIHKWLIGKKVTLRQLEKVIKSLNQELRIKNYGEHYFLKKREQLVRKRLYREKQSEIYFKKAKTISHILKVIPWVKLVGISGGLALNNASKRDDIDFFIITSKNRLWLSRFLVLGILTLIGQIRRRSDRGKQVAGKACINILLEEDNLEQQNKDIYIAHEVLQMRVLWQRDNIYSKYLENNLWVFKFLPNWIGLSSSMNNEGDRLQKGSSRVFLTRVDRLVTTFEVLAKRFQLWYMQSPKGLERIESGALYFHPEDCRLEVLNKYRKRISRLNIGTP